MGSVCVCVCARNPQLSLISAFKGTPPPNSLFGLLCSRRRECHLLTVDACPSPVSAPLCDPIGQPGLGPQECVGCGGEVKKDPEVFQGYPGKWGNIGRPQAK